MAKGTAIDVRGYDQTIDRIRLYVNNMEHVHYSVWQGDNLKYSNSADNSEEAIQDLATNLMGLYQSGATAMYQIRFHDSIEALNNKTPYTASITFVLNEYEPLGRKHDQQTVIVQPAQPVPTPIATVPPEVLNTLEAIKTILEHQNKKIIDLENQLNADDEEEEEDEENTMQERILSGVQTVSNIIKEPAVSELLGNLSFLAKQFAKKMFNQTPQTQTTTTNQHMNTPPTDQERTQMLSQALTRLLAIVPDLPELLHELSTKDDDTITFVAKKMRNAVKEL